MGQGTFLGHGLWSPSCPEYHFSNLLKQTQFGSYWWRELWTLSISDVKMSKFCGYLVLVPCKLAKLRGKWRAVEQFGTSTPKKVHVPMHTLGQQQIAQSRRCRYRFYRCYRADGQNPASVRLVEILTAIHEIFLYRYWYDIHYKLSTDAGMNDSFRTPSIYPENPASPNAGGQTSTTLLWLQQIMYITSGAKKPMLRWIVTW